MKTTPPAIGTSALRNNFGGIRCWPPASKLRHVAPAAVAPVWAADNVFGWVHQETWEKNGRPVNNSQIGRLTTNNTNNGQMRFVCVSISARHKYSTWRPSSAVDQLTSCNSVHHERKNVLVFIWLYLLLNNGVKWSQRTQDQRRFVSIWSDSISPSWLSPRTQSVDAERFRVERGQSDPSSIVKPRPHDRSAPDAQDLQRSLGFRISKWTSLYIVHWRSL